MPVLSHTRVTAEDQEPTRWLYLLHGIYGTGRNWGNIARRLVEERPGWGVILVDLRLHGGSLGFDPPHTVQACANDVARLEDSIGLPADAIVGHSFGGKVALLRGAAGHGRPVSLWVIDSTLRTSEPSGSAWRIIEIVRELPDRFQSRDEVADALAANGYARGVGQWLAMNLMREGGGFRWKLDWEGVENMLRDYFATDVWPIIAEPPAGATLHIVAATESDAIDEEAVTRIRDAEKTTSRVHLHRLSGGHWLNVDNPDGVLTLMVDNL